MPRRVLVAGSSGGIGAELARQLRAAGFMVFTLSRSGAASRLIVVMQGLTTQQHGVLLHWDGSVMPFNVLLI